jgi:hypothetical protein
MTQRWGDKMLSLPQRLAARISELDTWDDGGGIILDYEAGAHVVSYNGSHAWNAGAGHEGPVINPVLQKVRDEVVGAFQTLPPATSIQVQSAFRNSCREFDQNPCMRSLIVLAGLVDRFTPLYADLNPRYEIDTSADVVERDWDSRDD